MDITLEKKLCGYKQIAIEKLENILLTIFGKKDLVVEPELIRILDSFANMTWLKSKGFEKIFKLSQTPPPKTRTLVYMIFSNLTTFKQVLDQISLLKYPHSLETEAIKEFHIIVVPSLPFTFRHLTEMEGLDGIVSLYRFSYDFVKIDRNLLSLETPSIFQQVFVQKDRTLLSGIANSFRIFNMIHKHPKVIFTCGENSEKIIEMVARMENFRKRERVGDEFPDFSAMLVIDRDVDYPSCLLTPVTYSGLMIELFDMKAGILNIDPESNKVSSGKLDILKNTSDNGDSEPSDVKSLRMCGTSDELYTYNKYRHFSEVVNLIKSESKNLEQERRKYSRDMNIEQMKDFVEQNLPKVAAQKKVLYKHLIICERIVQEMSGNFERLQSVEEFIVRNENKKQVLNFIDENLNTNAHRYNILRLAALYHIFTGGLSNDEMNKFMSAYLNTFGHKHLHIFHNLFKAKLFPDFLRPGPKNLITIASNLTKKTPFMNDAIKLKLIPGSESETLAGGSKQKETKACPSYVFNGNYIPLVAQLAQIILKSESFSEFTGKIGSFNMKASFGDELKALKDIQNAKTFPLKPKTLFIFIVGGITYAEVAACNMIESLTGSKVVLASDEITCGTNIIKAASL